MTFCRRICNLRPASLDVHALLAGVTPKRTATVGTGLDPFGGISEHPVPLLIHFPKPACLSSLPSLQSAIVPTIKFRFLSQASK